jgi:hypothetical protein
MRLTLIALLSVLYSFSFAQKNAALQLVDATQKKWIGGNPSSGSGEKFVVYLRLNSSQKIEITKVWVKQQEVFFELQNYRMLLDRAPAKGDTIAVIYNPRYHNEKPVPDLATNSKPCKTKAQAVIEYSIDQKKHYLKVKKFRTLNEHRHQ